MVWIPLPSALTEQIFDPGVRLEATWDTLLSSVSLGIHDGDDHPHTTGSTEVA
jgi:hypothetical protein